MASGVGKIIADQTERSVSESHIADVLTRQHQSTFLVTIISENNTLFTLRLCLSVRLSLCSLRTTVLDSIEKENMITCDELKTN